MKKLDYSFLECARVMPPLRHSIPGEEYDISRSEAAAWIASRPDVIQKIFNMAQNNKVIRYDPGTGKWQGVDYRGN